MSQSLMHKLRLNNSVANIVASHSRDGLLNFRYLTMDPLRSKLTIWLSGTAQNLHYHRNFYSTLSSTTSDTAETPKKVSNLPRRNSVGKFNIVSKTTEKRSRTPPPIVNNLPSRKPLHQSTDIQGTMKAHHQLDTSVDMKEQLRKAYDDALHFCQCKLKCKRINCGKLNCCVICDIFIRFLF